MAAGATRRGRCRGVALCGLLVWVQMGCSGSKADVQTQPASRPAVSQPASERVLIRISDKAVVTQADVEKLLRNVPVERRRSSAHDILRIVLNNKTFLLYLQEHPEVVTEQDVDKEIALDLKTAKIKSVEDLKRGLQESGVSWDEYLGMAKIRAAQSKMMRLGLEKVQDEAYLRKVFDEHPDHFNDTRVRLRHIVFAVPLSARPEEKKARYDELARLREEILSGKKTWDEAVQLSNDNTRSKGGLLGPLPRYLRLDEPLIGAAWPLQAGQITDVVESPMGLHIVQVMERIPGTRSFDDPHTKYELRTIIQGKPLGDVLAKIRREYFLVGVQPIDMASVMALPPPATKPAMTPSTRPATRPTTRPVMTRPSMRPATRPGAVKPATRPAPVVRPTTRVSPVRPAATRPATAAPTPRPPVRPQPATTRPASLTRPEQGN